MLIQASIKFDQPMITPVEIGAKLSPLKHEAGTLSNIGVDDVETAVIEPYGSPTQREENAKNLPVACSMLTCIGESGVDIDEASKIA